MNFKRIVILVLIFASIVLFVFFWMAGFFDDVKITIEDAGPYNLVFREHTGPYRGIKFVLYDVYRYLKDKKSIEPERAFAIFYDNPQKVKPENLRSAGGYIIDSLIDITSPYKTQIFNRTTVIKGEFPIKSYMSQFTGPAKFYPRLYNHVKKNKLEISGNIMEIYEVKNKRIIYIVPIKKINKNK
jgi:DNA gyrase inhibitor GyrI